MCCWALLCCYFFFPFYTVHLGFSCEHQKMGNPVPFLQLCCLCLLTGTCRAALLLSPWELQAQHLHLAHHKVLTVLVTAPDTFPGWLGSANWFNSSFKRKKPHFDTFIPLQKPIVARVIKRKWGQKNLPSLQYFLHLTLFFIEVHSEGSDWKVSLGFVCFS